MSNKRDIARQRRRLRVDLAGAPLFTLDVSPGGFCAESMRVLRPGSPIEGQIRMADRAFSFTGKVAWSRAGEPRLQLRGRMGVQLTAVEPEYLSLFSQP